MDRNDDKAMALQLGPATLWVGSLRIDLANRRASVGNTVLKLTAKEYQILEVLVLRRGTVLGKQVFIDIVYGKTAVSKAKMIDIFICKLRKKLAIAGIPNVIGTAWGRGYMLYEPDQKGYNTQFTTGERER
ncbi:winged helix-turn-helix domain-containing protein [Acidisphaera sp. L21]|uniref:winged helix-turn-helix domain-containing protein n=1 Tax=Acidisphaera sp. L21 TaxID=1641851 RepID=UPI0020B15EA9|nr:winged helix-turn-helix domain-containing protein [Acidisphaera sp. L21]